jgi:hypothetical protein
VACYDAQPHPDGSTLQRTDLHHKLAPPDIKHNRIPAPEMSFARPSLAVLMAEIERLLQKGGGCRVQDGMVQDSQQAEVFTQGETEGNSCMR